MARLFSISDDGQSDRPGYVEGLGNAASAALEHLLLAIEQPEGSSLQPPSAVLKQARAAARAGISLETVMRRCFAGYTVFTNFLVEEAESGDHVLPNGSMKQVLQSQASFFDRLVAAVTDEYTRETGGYSGSPEGRRTRVVEQLLAGELRDSAELAYDFNAKHLGLIAKGDKAMEALLDLAKAADRRLLAVEREDGLIWAWLGCRRDASGAEVERILHSTWPAEARLAVGEPTAGLSGWRLSHQQALATMPTAISSPQAFTRYSDVALLVSITQDDLLATSLRRRYLTPLADERGSSMALRETLRAYLAADRNISSAGAMLGVNRRTVANRIRIIEERLGCPVRACAAELEVALRLAEHDATQPLLDETPEGADGGHPGSQSVPTLAVLT